jgi:hypothetical protein
MTSVVLGLAAAALTAAIAWLALRRGSRIVAGATVVLAATVAFPTAAGATASSITVTAWLGAVECEQTHIYINNTAGYPHLDAYGAGYYTGTNFQGVKYCDSSSGVRFPTGYVVTREDLYAYSPEISGWVRCNTGPMVYNGVPSYISKTGYNWPYPAACYSQDYYFGAGYGAVYNGGWQGGWHNTPASVYVV